MDFATQFSRNDTVKRKQFIENIEKNIKKIRLRHFFEHQDGTMLSYMKAIKETTDLIIAQLQGPIDVETVPIVCLDLKGKLERYLDKNILLDFKDVTHVDSATVANLVYLLNQLQHRHRKLGITHVSATLESYINIDKLGALIHVYKDEGEATRELSAQTV